MKACIEEIIKTIEESQTLFKNFKKNYNPNFFKSNVCVYEEACDTLQSLLEEVQDYDNCITLKK